MADGMIIRRGGGAGMALNIIGVEHAALIPQSPREDTIAVIGAGSGTAYVQEAIPEAAEGDIWITPEDKVYDINLVKKGSILIGIGNVYRFQEGEWKDAEAYIFRDGKWQHVWNKVLYKNGKMTERVEHQDMLSPTTCKVTYGDSYIQCVTKAGKASEVYAVFGPVKLTDITTLIASGTYPVAQGGTTYAVLAVAKGSDASFTDKETTDEHSVKNTVNGNKAGQEFEIQLDVSGLTGDHYVYIGTNTAGGAWANTRYVNFTALKGV